MKQQLFTSGGLFLLYKAVKEIHHTIAREEEIGGPASGDPRAFITIISQIVLLDVVFSVDFVEILQMRYEHNRGKNRSLER